MSTKLLTALRVLGSLSGVMTKTDTQTQQDPKREERKWWAVTDRFSVVNVIGYSCSPMNPNHWWCPGVGFSGMEGESLFNTKEAAVEIAIKKANAELENLKCRIEELKMLQNV